MNLRGRVDRTLPGSADCDGVVKIRIKSKKIQCETAPMLYLQAMTKVLQIVHIDVEDEELYCTVAAAD